MPTNAPNGLLPPPTMASYTAGTGTPQNSAIAASINMNNRHAALNKIGGRKYKGGSQTTAGRVAVPQYANMPYTPAGGPGTNPNSQIAGLSSTSMQGSAWKVNDNLATQQGGTKRFIKGGYMKWGCYSGGKTKSKKHKKKRNKLKKHTRRRLH